VVLYRKYLRLSMLDCVDGRCILKNFPVLGNDQTPNGQILKTIAIEISELEKAIVLGVFVSTYGIVAANQDVGALFAPRPYFPFSLV
jgi:hypothetical protein